MLTYRAVEHALAEQGQPIGALSYHGDLSSSDRDQNLRSFRSGDCQYLICTDIAARGLDIPEVGNRAALPVCVDRV
jgi:ATP-dependent RNA helicase DeaD